MNKFKIGALALAVTMATAGCADMSETQRGTAMGAGAGAVLGGLVGGIAGPGGAGRTAAGAAIGAAIGAVGGNIWSKHMQDQKMAMERATAGTNVQVTQTADNRLKVNVPADTGFATGRADINPALRPILDQLASSLAQNPAALIEVYGHTDSTGTDAINGPLSRQRAQNVSSYLSSRGIAPNRITMDGLGSSQPLVANDTASNRAMNRRVEIYTREQAPQ
ncbi:OmpA family protein [Collimonas sp.]|jgi:outer membrane protein OmpA-like peptidoglycan-associated protein|uniref:OmpA family protein n=1 Tax=Collimonas sp. TaxID=1963772 RepID=UPI002B97A579|nr:OmpA family protein [Collimonas sp.]HWW07759.1 OmpA family protein [Collimonas sp.]